ncbi:DNA gyrase inhibitor [Oenococcus sp. UCMA 14587]|nr:DNA gyrase inhibitor [Oenococcus sp. UCMA 14587]
MKIEHLSATKIVYFRRVGIYGVENMVLMQSFKQWIKTEGLFQGSTILGIALDNLQIIHAKNCHYDVCLITDKTSFKNSVQQRTLTTGNYAVFKLAHTEKVINEFYTNITKTINKNQLKVLNRPIIERYQQKLVDNGYCEILIPVK